LLSLRHNVVTFGMWTPDISEQTSTYTLKVKGLLLEERKNSLYLQLIKNNIRLAACVF